MSAGAGIPTNPLAMAGAWEKSGKMPIASEAGTAGEAGSLQQGHQAQKPSSAHATSISNTRFFEQHKFESCLTQHFRADAARCAQQPSGSAHRQGETIPAGTTKPTAVSSIRADLKIEGLRSILDFAMCQSFRQVSDVLRVLYASWQPPVQVKLGNRSALRQRR